MRYWTGYGRSGAYAWRFDAGRGGSGGVSGDLGSHWAYLARWYFGEIDAVTAVVHATSCRATPRPDGVPVPTPPTTRRSSLLEFENGATGSLHVTSLAYEPGPFGQRHDWDLAGQRRNPARAQRLGQDPARPRLPRRRAGAARAADPRRHLGQRPARHRARHLPGHVPAAGPHDPRVRHRGRGRPDGVARLSPTASRSSACSTRRRGAPWRGAGSGSRRSWPAAAEGDRADFGRHAFLISGR